MRIKNWLSDLFTPAPRSRRRRRKSWNHLLAAEVLEDRTLLSASSFVELSKLTASDAAAIDFFGATVAVSADGGTVVVGSHSDDDSGSSSGSAYVYHWDGSSFTETKLTASDAAAEDRFGGSVAVSADGETVVVGTAGNDDSGSGSGSAYVYHWDGSSFFETKLTASDAAGGDFFGHSVAVSADGGTVVVGSFFDDPEGRVFGDSGSAYVYHWDDSSFTETKLTASDAETNDLFGVSVAVSADGGTVVVGSLGGGDFGVSGGSAYVYHWDGSSFTETKLTASDAAGGDFFGGSVAVSDDGGTVVVGSYGDDDAGSLSGSAHIYDWDSSSFTETKLTASDAAAEDRFGFSVAVSGDGETVIVGSPSDDDSGSSRGSAYVYERDGSSFFETKLTASDAAAGDFFGGSVAVSADGGTVVVGSRSAGDAGTFSGAAYVFVSEDTPTNEPPTGADFTKTGTEDNPLALSAADFVAHFTDPDGDTLTEVRIDSLPANGTLQLGGSDIAGGQVIAVAELDDLVFLPDLNFNGQTVFDYSASDGTNFSATPATVTLDIAAVNDDPTVASPVAVTSNEDAAAFSVDLLASTSDVDADSLNAANVALTAGDSSGVTVNGNKLDVDASKYNHLAAGETEVITYSYDVIDGNGGSVVQTATITIEGRNDAPAGAEFTKTGTEDSQVNFSAADFITHFSDPDTSDTLKEVRIDALPANGTLTLNGAAVTAGQVLSVADLDNLVFVPNLNFNSNTTFTYSASDGLAFAVTPATVTLHILSAAEQADVIFGKIQDLLDAGLINEGQAESLTFMLKDNNGDSGKVQAFLNEVQGYINGGILTEEQAHDLLVCGNLLLITLETV